MCSVASSSKTKLTELEQSQNPAVSQSLVLGIQTTPDQDTVFLKLAHGSTSNPASWARAANRGNIFGIMWDSINLSPAAPKSLVIMVKETSGQGSDGKLTNDLPCFSFQRQTSPYPRRLPDSCPLRGPGRPRHRHRTFLWHRGPCHCPPSLQV